MEWNWQQFWIGGLIGVPLGLIVLAVRAALKKRQRQAPPDYMDEIDGHTIRITKDAIYVDDVPSRPFPFPKAGE